MLATLKKVVLVDASASPRNDGHSLGQYLFLALLFLLTRGIVLYTYQVYDRGLLDGEGYILLSRFIQENGRLPITEGFGRFFPGLPILMALLNSLVNNLYLSGFVIVWSTGLMAVLLFHYLFRDFRMSVIHTVFLTAWLANTSTIVGEGTALFLFLLFLYSLKLDRFRIWRYLCMFIAGYALVCRPTTGLLIFPYLLYDYWIKPEKKLTSLIGEGFLLGLPLLLYCGWAYATIGEIAPQLALQKQTFIYHVERSKGYYPVGPLTWPGYALFLGFFDFNYVSILKKLFIFGHVVLVIIAAWNLISACRLGSAVDKYQEYYRPFCLTFFIILIFTLMIGGPFGHTQFYRYLASHMNPIIIFALFSQHQLRWIWIAALIVLSTALGCFTCTLGPF